MDSDDFFNDMSKKITENKVADQKSETREKDLTEFMQSAIKDITPMLKKYHSKLLEFGIKSELQINKTSFSLSMKHKNGDPHDLTFGQDFRDEFNAFIFKGHYRDEKTGKPYSASDYHPFTEESWDVSEVEKRIQKHIDDYISYQSRHR